MNGTPSYARLHEHGLTLAQQSAVDLLASGKTDTETAELLKLARPTVTKWRLYDPVFQAALNSRRTEIWGAGPDRLRSMIPRALDVIAEGLKSGHWPSKFKSACVLLSIARVPLISPSGPTSAEGIIAELVKERLEAKKSEREKYMDAEGRLLQQMMTPNKERAEKEERETRAEILAEIAAKLNEAERSDADA